MPEAMLAGADAGAAALLESFAGIDARGIPGWGTAGEESHLARAEELGDARGVLAGYVPA